MKKLIVILLIVLVVLAMPLGAVAVELTGCTITVDPAAAGPGETVTVAVRIGDNPGFTNLAVALDYDQEHLTLKSIDTKGEEAYYLCDGYVSSNTAWENADGSTGFVVFASSESVKENGILFTATFEIAADFTGELEITPDVQYVRNNEAVFSIFETIHAIVSPGTVTSILAGDVNGDGIVEYDDVMLAYKAFLGEAELTARQMAALDRDGSGSVEEAEYQAIYQIYIGG